MQQKTLAISDRETAASRFQITTTRCNHRQQHRSPLFRAYIGSDIYLSAIYSLRRDPGVSTVGLESQVEIWSWRIKYQSNLERKSRIAYTSKAIHTWKLTQKRKAN